MIVNALVGFFQEQRAENALEALRTMTAPRARVRREGRQTVVAAAEVVPRDILLLEAGDVVAVPEGLPAMVKIALAIGVQRMSERNVPIRRLPAVETRGSATRRWSSRSWRGGVGVRRSDAIGRDPRLQACRLARFVIIWGRR